MKSGFSRAVGTPLNPAAAVKPPTAPQHVDLRAMEASYRRQLEELNPSATLSVELPYQGNGNLYQVRTTVSGLVFYGRAATEEEAVVKCCRKAVGHMHQHWDRNSNCPREPDRERAIPATPAAPAAPSAAQDRRLRREQELRSEMGSVMAMLDRRSRGPEPPRAPERPPRAPERPPKVPERPPSPKAPETSLTFSNLKQIPIKNAVMMLNEMFPPPKAPQYKVTSQTGPPNNPTFTMVCSIEDRHFSGEGKLKFFIIWCS